MSEDECTRPFFRARRSSSRFVQFSGHGVSRKHHRDRSPTFPDLLDGRTSERTRRKSTSARIVTGVFPEVFFFFDDADNYSRLARVDVDGELLDGRTDTSGMYPIFRWSIQFPRQLTPGPGTEGFTRTRDIAHMYRMLLVHRPSRTRHMPGRVWISIKPREFPRRIVPRRDGASGGDSLTRFSPGFVQRICVGSEGGSFFFTHVSCRRGRRRAKSIHSTSRW